MRRQKLAAVFFAAAMVLGLAASAGAVDGTIEINQAKVLAAGGFPYVISTANTSYRLTGSLSVPASTNGINVTKSSVTIDLNGFTISGPGSSSVTPIGINAVDDITVENGTVTGFGLAVKLQNSGIVRKVHVDSNVDGINMVGDFGLVEGCTANNLGAPAVGFGIACNTGCVISGNTASRNNVGIECASGCLISGNTLSGNQTAIFLADATSGYGGNVLNSNTTGISGGTSLGAKNTNLCSGTAC